MSMTSVRNLLNKSLSSSKRQSNLKKSPLSTSKSHTFADENAAPIDPNIQSIEPQFPLSSNPKKSPSKLSISRSKVLESSRSDPIVEHSTSPDPPVKVVVRIRPKTVNEKLGDPTIRKISEDSVSIGDREFDFNSVLDSNTKQEDVFDLVGVPLVKDALAGYNSSILSYGQTGSGKTYTMWGPPSAMVEGQSPSTQQGIVPRIFKKLFFDIEREKVNSEDKQINYQCRCSFLEIYNGQIGDLLDPTQRNLKIKDDARNGFYIENLTEEYVTSYDDVTQILIKGLSSRKVGATSVNSKSSRSHIVFTCVIESWCKCVEQETPSSNISSSKTSRISLIDLAGMGRDKQADAGREFERERKELNSSLSHLGHLVNILAAGTQPDDLMYRDSCLTHLLQQSLGGNSKLSVICTISPDIKNYVETLSTLRFGQRVKSIQNKPVVNEITEEDMDDLTDQIRQLKEELIKAKLNVRPASSENGQLAGKSVRESINQLRISLNRSLVLPAIDNEIEEHVNADETDVRDLCKHFDHLNRSCEEISKDMSCDSDTMSFSSVRGSCDSYFTSEHEINCLHESVEVSSDQALQCSRSSMSISSSRHSAAFEEPALSESPKIKNTTRKSMVSSPSLLAEQNIVNESAKFCEAVPGKSVRQSEPMLRSSLRSSKMFSGPTESLAASLRRGLEVIDSHQQHNLSKSSVAFSFEHLMLKPSPAVDKAYASVQTLSDVRPSIDGSPSSFMCISCRQKGQNVSNEVEDSLKTWITANNEEKDADTAQAINVQKELEKVCSEQATKIEELNHLVEQLKQEKENNNALQNNQEIEDKVSSFPSCNDGETEDQEPEIIKEACAIEDKCEIANGSFDMREREELLMEIQLLKSKLQAYTTDAAPNKSIDKLRSSLLSRSMNLRKNMSTQFNNAEELEKERERWTEMESEWINLTEELRIDIEAHRQHAEKVEMDLQQQKKYAEELDDALHRSVLGHARFVEHYVDLQEKYDHLSESHRRIMETVTDVKKAAAKAGAKGTGARYVKAFAAELSTMRAEEKRERERLRRENKGLRLQLRETAEAVQTAGELLVRLREAEEAASLAESNLTDLQQENDKLRKQLEKQKNKHKMEMVTMKQYMAESKLPESALRPIHYDEPLPTSTFTSQDDDDAWKAEFGAIYQDHRY
ncbi:kinesin-like protein KIN-12F isoform X1 [Chenopodium quinoa]|uniref:kinesin-like protein KIN-12F isoform X1 n=1 Tax=Chenopodium quinoa TaxID=63459 RepID=UPI000B788442|nr:kinesin-like protein KIN-12F isoform X1 [Chenopodium quinoa]